MAVLSEWFEDRFCYRAMPLIALLLVCGCAAAIHDMSRVQYVNETFTAQSLSAGGLALLPIRAGDGQEGYRRPLGDFLNAELQNSVPGGRVLTWQASMDSINAHDQVAIYEQIISAYQTTSILDRELVRQLHSTLNVRYALYASLQDYSTKSETHYNLFSGFSTQKTAQVVAQCLIVDLNSGDVAQEIIGQTGSVGGDFNTMRPYEDYASLLARAVLSRLPGSSVADPNKSKKPTSSDDNF